MHGLKRFNTINLVMMIVIFIEILLLTFLFQHGVISLQAHYYFVFVVGSLLVSAYLFYAAAPKQIYYIPIHIFLWMFLLYGHQPLLFYSAGFVFIAATVYYIAQSPIPAKVKVFYYVLTVLSVVAGMAYDQILLFISCTSYMVMMVLYSTSINKMLKWHMMIVTMLHMLAIAGNATDISFPYQENTIFTVPVSFIIFVVIVLNDNVMRSIHALLFAPSIVFLLATAVLFSYSLASYLLINAQVNVFPLYWAISMLMGLLSFILCYMIDRVVTARYKWLQAKLDYWFELMFQDAIAQYDQDISWSGFQSKIAELLPNDGFLITINEQTAFSSGCFLKPSFTKGRRIDSGGVVAMYIHERNTHMPYTASNYYTFIALVRYLDHKLSQWQEIRKLKLSFAEPAGDFGKNLKFRQDVTYYLHDNILQNIIATKNIIGSLPTEQSALKELAVETLTELNSSIRSQMHEIYPSTLADLSFERNIHILLDEMRKRYGYIPTPHITYELVDRMDETTAYLFYRTLQELFTNTCKYAQADNIWIHLYADKDWILEVREDGIPIKEEDMEVKIKHLGISSLKQQASSLQGGFEMKQMEDHKLFKLTVPRRIYENTIV